MPQNLAACNTQVWTNLPCFWFLIDCVYQEPVVTPALSTVPQQHRPPAAGSARSPATITRALLLQLLQSRHHLVTQARCQEVH